MRGQPKIVSADSFGCNFCSDLDLNLQVDTAALLHFLGGWDLIAGEFAASGVAEPSVALA